MDSSRSMPMPPRRLRHSAISFRLVTPLKYTSATLVEEVAPMLCISATKSGVRRMRRSSVKLVRSDSLNASCEAKAVFSISG